jgi:hypothetical protein
MMTAAPLFGIDGPLYAAWPANAGAIFDETRTYRYSLWRCWDYGGVCVFVMLNPSTADEMVLDPTIRRCISFAKHWGLGAIEVVNLFALRSTDPRGLYSHESPVAPLSDRYANDLAIEAAARRASKLIVAWGEHGSYLDRSREVSNLLRCGDVEPEALALNSGGMPRHPLYIPTKTIPQVWR